MKKKSSPRNPDYCPGGKYDPDEAKKLDWKWNGERKGSETYVSETLYKGRNGEYFLSGEGGADTKYNDPSVTPERIIRGVIPLTRSEARAWAERTISLNALLERDPVRGGYRNVFEDVDPLHTHKTA
tara:strand:+ start:389 stop:769 length:381 start_codon:yes stop_codon:yes gene_type:complete